MLNVVEVNSVWQALVMRSIRNDGRKFMTRQRRYITLIDQLFWYWFKYSENHHAGRLYCYLFYEEKEAVGYGLAAIRPDGVWISGGLRKDVRGRGLGTELFTFLVEKWGYRKMFLEVLDYNTAGLKIYRKLGFRKIGTRYNTKVLVMQRKATKTKLDKQGHNAGQ